MLYYVKGKGAFRMRKLFLTAAGLLYAVFLFLDLTLAGNSAPLKFAAILLCFAAALCGPQRRRTRSFS